MTVVQIETSDVTQTKIRVIGRVRAEGIRRIILNSIGHILVKIRLRVQATVEARGIINVDSKTMNEGSFRPHV